VRSTESSYIRHMKQNSWQLPDAALLLLVGTTVAVGVSVRADGSSRPLALALGLAAVGALAIRRRAPTVALAVSGGLVFAVFAVDHEAGAVAVVAPAVALYSLTLSRGRVHLFTAVAAIATAVAVVDVLLGTGNAHRLTLQTAAHVALVAIPVLAAEAMRSRRAYVQLLLERLEQAERTREEEAQRRAEQERLRIARDLHDVVAHTLTTINVQAGVAAHLLDRDPYDARGALATIETASHDALEELRAILGVLREPGNGGAPLEPAPDLAMVGGLIDKARANGLEINFEVEGEQPPHVPEPVQVAVFRILQEALTNAGRHAPGAPSRVNLAYHPDRLRLSIENHTTGARNGNGSGEGVGILGMRERARALGGTLQAQRSGERFQVVADLPYNRST
jgi:signal transduction histidine kinase